MRSRRPGTITTRDGPSECRRESAHPFIHPGALAGQKPSRHTLTTKFFPLDLFRRDEERAAAIAKRLPAGMSLREVALRFAISHPDVASAIVGFGSPEEVEEAAAYVDKGPLDETVLTLVG